MRTRSKLLTGAAVAVVVTALTGCFPANAVTRANYRATVTGSDIVLDAHRTGGLDLRENSIASALALVGKVDVIDIDVQHLKDGTPVLMHDATVDRTTNKSGPVSSFTTTTWKSVTLNTGKGPAGEKAPTLSAFLDALGGKAVLTVEAKTAGELAAIESRIKVRGLQGSVLINSNSVTVARKIKSDGYLSQVWRTHQQMVTDNPADFRFADVVDIDFLASDADIAKFTKAVAPRQVWGHTVNTQADVARMLRLGVNGIITDKPVSVGRGN